jgi:NAD(P)-dependent dehydrogenase (short-subunit alcohol dehydrogenase family)
MYLTTPGSSLLPACTSSAAAAAAAAAAVTAMHRNAAATWASKNVRINCVAAGLMDAPSSAEVSQDETTAAAAAEVRQISRAWHRLTQGLLHT